MKNSENFFNIILNKKFVCFIDSCDIDEINKIFYTKPLFDHKNNFLKDRKNAYTILNILELPPSNLRLYSNNVSCHQIKTLKKEFRDQLL